MNLPLLTQSGEWNPQLFRELKGRFTPRNLTIAVVVSLLAQLLVVINFASRLPVDNIRGDLYNKYCVTSNSSRDSKCLHNALGDLEINWQLWSLDVFIWLSIIGVFAMLVVGTYMIISDLSREEHRGTLNFIRLSPQSTQTILLGKLLGVPILLYIAAALALPLHLWFGLAAHISLSLILSFYAVLAASCVFFYSASLIYGLVSAGLGGFQAWLGSGSLLMFLFVTLGMASSSTIINHNAGDWLMLFNPSFILAYLVASLSLPLNVANEFFSRGSDLESLRSFYLPVGKSVAIASGLMLLNYGLWTYWAWQALNRCFHNPTATILSKRQSYLLTACFEVLIVGFSLQPRSWDGNSPTSAASISYRLFENFSFVLAFNLLLFTLLIAALSPHRQTLQDWARYRHQKRSSRKWGIVSSLIWGEKSPAVVAVALNLAIATSILISWVLLWPGSEFKMAAFFGLVLSANLILLYAFIGQLMLFMKTNKRVIWAASIVGGLIILPPIIFRVMQISPGQVPGVWLFSAFAWAAVKDASTSTVFLALLGQWLTLSVLGLQLTRQLRLAGESETKVLLAGRSVKGSFEF